MKQCKTGYLDWERYIENQTNNYVTYLIYVCEFFKKITMWYSSSRPNKVIKKRKYDIAFFHTFKRVHLVNLLLITLTQNQTYAKLSLYCSVGIHNMFYIQSRAETRVTIQEIRNFALLTITNIPDIFFRNKLFLSRQKTEIFSIFMIEDFVKPHKISAHSENPQKKKSIFIQIFLDSLNELNRC